MKKLAEYKNGNYTVILFNDGTKVRILKEGETEFKPEFPENIDCLISKKCSIGCEFCHECATPEGEIGDWEKHKNILEQLHIGTEIALGGGALSEYPRDKFIELLAFLKRHNIFTNITINSKELLNKSFKKFLIDMIDGVSVYGIGISYNKDCKEQLLEMETYSSNIVIHTINGITSPEDYKWLAENKFKVLILGFKDFGRGRFYQPNEEYSEWLDKNLDYLKKNCRTLSFDCLAVEQLKLKEKVTPEEWEKFYMGDDGKFTMYLDLVKGQYGKNSTTPIYERNYFSFMGISLKLMFKNINKY